MLSYCVTVFAAVDTGLFFKSPLWDDSPGSTRPGPDAAFMPINHHLPHPVSLLPVSFVPPRRLRATYSSVGCALPQVTGSGSELDWYPVLVTCAKPCTLPRRRGHLCLIHPNATYGPALALRPGVWWDPDLRVHSLSPSTQHNPYHMNTQEIHIHELLNGLINELEWTMRQKRGSL